MKKILLATDFSETSRNAALFAISMAKSFHSELVLFHAYHPPLIPVTAESAAITHKEMEAAARESLKKEMNAIARLAPVSISRDCLESLPADGILLATEQHNADLVVMGLRQAGRGIRKAFSSTATKLVRQSKVPVIVVPGNIPTKRIETIVVAYDGDFNPEDDIHVLDMVKQLGYRFNAKVYVVHVAETQFQEIYHVLNKPFRLMRMMGKLPAVTETIHSKNIIKALSIFMKEHRADMLAVLPEKKNFLKRLFQGSTTKRLLFETEVPLLLLPGYHEGTGKWWAQRKRKQRILI